MKKNIFIVTLIILFIYVFSSLVLASVDDNNIPEKRHSEGYTWKIKSINSVGTETKGNWKLGYEGEPARRTGESDTFTISTSYSHSFSGSFAIETLKPLAELQLGYTFGKSLDFSVSKTSSSLKKGEYVKGYFMNNYEKSKIIQEELYYNTKNNPIYRPTGKTKIVYAYEAILPKIKLTYHMSPNRSSIDNNYLNQIQIYKEEYYEPNHNGQYELVEVIEYKTP
ncbi:MAG: hypothetical protein GX981_09160 [Tissierellia bacterium]|nr:hypothetical protein [Tissierellia bacterium]